MRFAGLVVQSGGMWIRVLGLTARGLKIGLLGVGLEG